MSNKKSKVLVIGKYGNLSGNIYALSSTEVYKNYDCEFVASSELNLLETDSIKYKLSTYQPDIIINCAAYTYVDKAENPACWDEVKAINWHAVRHIAEYAAENNIYLVHFSTDYVFYGWHKETPYKENDYATTKNIYGFTKLQGEGEVNNIMERFLTIRLSWLFNYSTSNFFTKITKKLLEDDIVKVTNDKIGTPTYAYEVALALPRILDQAILNPAISGIYHFSHNEPVSWYEFTQKIATSLKNHGAKPVYKKLVPISTEETEYTALRPDYSPLCSDLIQDTFRFKISSLDDAIDHCAKEYLHLHRL